MSKKSKKELDRINNNPELKRLYHHYDSTGGLWVIDSLDEIPLDKRHLFDKLKRIEELEQKEWSN